MQRDGAKRRRLAKLSLALMHLIAAAVIIGLLEPRLAAVETTTRR